MDVAQLFESQHSGNIKCSGELVARIVGNIVPQKGMAASIGQYTPVILS